MAEASTLVTEDINKAHTAIENAIAKGTVQGSHLLVARAYGIMCQLAAPMSLTDATSACDNARQSYAAAGDRNNEARTLNDFAGVSYQQGDLVRAEALWREAAHVFRQVGDIEGLAATANNLGDVSLLEGWGLSCDCVSESEPERPLRSPAHRESVPFSLIGALTVRFRTHSSPEIERQRACNQDRNIDHLEFA